MRLLPLSCFSCYQTLDETIQRPFPHVHPPMHFTSNIVLYLVLEPCRDNNYGGNEESSLLPLLEDRFCFQNLKVRTENSGLCVVVPNRSERSVRRRFLPKDEDPSPFIRNYDLDAECSPRTNYGLSSSGVHLHAHMISKVPTPWR